jgi:sugar lactone lactonase YvrE
MTQPSIQMVSTARHLIGESPTWDAPNGRLLWCSISDGEIYALTIATGVRQKWAFAGERVGSFGLCESGRLVVALTSSVELFDPVSGGRQMLARIRHPVMPMRLNDGKVGPDGAFFVGSMDDGTDKGTVGSLYRVAPDGSVRVIAGGLKVSNGLARSPDGRTMYHSDSRGPWIDAWDFETASGGVSNRRRFATLTTEIGRPDGAACDVDGYLWSAGTSAGVVNRFSPAGVLVERIEMPNFRPTMPCFGGPDMRTVYVTSLSENLTPEQLAAHPLAGTTMNFLAPVAGAPVARFKA